MCMNLWLLKTDMLGEPHKFIQCLLACMENFAQQSTCANTKEKMGLGFYTIIRLSSHAVTVTWYSSTITYVII
jgi:hypothetical protein